MLSRLRSEGKLSASESELADSSSGERIMCDKSSRSVGAAARICL
jgi:hypothetical protein